jgi:hypothetical protein
MQKSQLELAHRQSLADGTAEATSGRLPGFE